MARKKNDTVWVCLNCGTEYRKEPFGECSSCGDFQNFEERASNSSESTTVAGMKASKIATPTKKLSKISEINKKPITRTLTNIVEFDRVMGGGYVDAEVVLFTGMAGSGKSSLALSIANNFAQQDLKILYSSGEESEQQIGLRASRMNVNNDNILIVNETNIEKILGYINEEKPDFVIVDSLQTVASDNVSGSMGSISQSKEAANILTHTAKQQNIKMLLINQMVKNGDFAGSEGIQHIVDCTLILESSKDTPLKFLRAKKNRFGDTTEVGVFQHAESGLEEVKDPGNILLDDNANEYSGTSASFISEGIRQIPVEIQALASESNLPTPRKQFTGVNYNRGQIVCAILDKYCRTRLYERDVFVNTVSGITVNDPLADLSIAASILSSIKNQTFKDNTAFVGELSLTGQIRGNFMIENKIKEAERLGYDTIIVPQNFYKNFKKTRNHKIKIHGATNIKDLYKFLTTK